MYIWQNLQSLTNFWSCYNLISVLAKLKEKLPETDVLLKKPSPDLDLFFNVCVKLPSPCLNESVVYKLEFSIAIV